MALIRCAECDKEISDKAKQCPHCGCPLKAHKVKKMGESGGGINTWIIVCAVLCFIIALMEIFKLYIYIDVDIKSSLFTVGRLDIYVMGYLAFVLGMSYIGILVNKNKQSFYIMSGVNLIILIYNVVQICTNIKLGISFVYIALVFSNVFITWLVLRKQLINDKLSIKKNKFLMIGFAIGLVGLFGFNCMSGLNFPQTNKRNENVEQVEIIADYVNIRSNPSVDSDVLGQVYKNEIYTVLSEYPDGDFKWLEIKTSNGIKGYVAGRTDYVKRLDSGNVDDEVDSKPDVDISTSTDKPATNKPSSTTKPSNNGNTNANKPGNSAGNSNQTITDKPNTDSSTTSPTIPPVSDDDAKNENNEKREQYLKEVAEENSRYEAEIGEIKAQYDSFEAQAKDKMADAKYFASFFGGLYTGTERDYEREYQRLMSKGDYDAADILAGKWQHTQEYRKWEEYLRGLPQEEQNYLKGKQEAHEKILNELKQKYNQ